MSPIYVISREITRDDGYGRDYTDEQIDPDYGYFTDKNDAEAFAEKLNKPAREAYQERLDSYKKELTKNQRKAEEALKLGFRHDYYISQPWKPDLLQVIEVHPGKI